MDEQAKEFRQTKIGIVEFLAEPNEQRRFAEKVAYDDYAAEFSCWWLDDWYPESELSRAAFSPAEIAILCRLTAVLETTQTRPSSIESLLSTPQWQAVTRAAQKAVLDLSALAT